MKEIEKTRNKYEIPFGYPFMHKKIRNRYERKQQWRNRKKNGL